MAFVKDSWVKSARLLSSYFWTPMSIYEPSIRFAIEHLAPSTDVLLAVSTDDDTQVIGWAASDRVAPVLHYVYVKHFWRQSGLGRALVAACGKMSCHSHHPRVAVDWAPGDYAPQLFWSENLVSAMIRSRKARNAQPK